MGVLRPEGAHHAGIRRGLPDVGRGRERVTEQAPVEHAESGPASRRRVPERDEAAPREAERSES